MIPIQMHGGMIGRMGMIHETSWERGVGGEVRYERCSTNHNWLEHKYKWEIDGIKKLRGDTLLR